MDVSQMPGHLIRRLQQRSNQIFSQRTQAAGLDLTSVQFAALDAIATHPGADQATIAELIAFDRATIGGVVDRLLQKGWIQRSISQHDRRARVLKLTALGTRMLQKLQPLVEDLQVEILSPLNPAEQKTFAKLASKLIQQGD